MMLLLHAVTTSSPDPSKAPFFIVGGLLALGAVVLSLIGISRPTFPNNERSARLTMGVTGALVLAAIMAAILTDP